MNMPIDRTEGDVNRSSRRDLWRSSLFDDETRHWLELDEQYFIHQPLSTPCLDVLATSSGTTMTDLQGHTYLDFHGNNVHQIGYAHPAVIKAVKDQLDTLSFSPRRFTNRPAIELARALVERAPGNLNKVLFAPGGALAIGMALKLARLATGRHGTISFLNSFHGASLDAISVGGEDHFRNGLGPLMPGANLIPPPEHDDGTIGSAEACRRAVQDLEQLMVRDGNIGAVLAEPFRYTTVQVPHPEYWHGVREVCTRHGALLIFDEIPVCLGRAGTMFACERFGVVPDILCIGKGLAGGVYPLAAIIAREDLDRSYPTSLGHYTHEKNPVAAAAALATIRVIEEEGLLQRAMDMGELLRMRLEALRIKHPVISAIRGFGLAVGVELSAPQGRSVQDLAEQVMYASLERGLSFKVSGSSVLTLMPPLTIGEEDLDRAVRILDHALTAG